MDINEKVALEKPKFGQILPMVFSAIGSKPLELLKALLPPTVLLAAFGWLHLAGWRTSLTYYG